MKRLDLLEARYATMEDIQRQKELQEYGNCYAQLQERMSIASGIPLSYMNTDSEAWSREDWRHC